jgi:hypothetical protein
MLKLMNPSQYFLIVRLLGRSFQVWSYGNDEGRTTNILGLFIWIVLQV